MTFGGRTMNSTNSNLPKHVTQGYWVEVRRLLHTQHLLSVAAAARGVNSYRAVLAHNDVGDLIYHSSVEDTAAGIISGGYSATTKSQNPQSTHPLPIRGQ